MATKQENKHEIMLKQSRKSLHFRKTNFETLTYNPNAHMVYREFFFLNDFTTGKAIKLLTRKELLRVKETEKDLLLRKDDKMQRI